MTSTCQHCGSPLPSTRHYGECPARFELHLTRKTSEGVQPPAGEPLAGTVPSLVGGDSAEPTFFGADEAYPQLAHAARRGAP